MELIMRLMGLVLQLLLFVVTLAKRISYVVADDIMPAEVLLSRCLRSTVGTRILHGNS